MALLPTIFYRYRGFNTSTLDSLCHDRLFFAHPGTFNDPLDCSPTIECDSSLEEQRDLLAVLIRRRVTSEVLASLGRARIKGARASTHANKRAHLEAEYELASIAYNATGRDDGLSKVKAEELLLTSEIQQELRRYYERGVCCFSTTHSCPLLWSHYGDQHKGLCIGYGLDRQPKPEMHRVVYGGSRLVSTSVIIKALVLEDENSKKELDRKMLLQKAREWRYEKEWRLLGIQGEVESPLLLKEVTFGLRCPESVVYAVIQALSGRRERSVRYYKMAEKRDRFSLRRSAVDSGELSVTMPIVAMSPVEMFGNDEDLRGSGEFRWLGS